MHGPLISTILTLLAVARLAHCTSKTYTASFDDEGQFSPPAPVGFYDSLSWVHFDRLYPYLYQGKVLIGILPSSGYVYAAFGSGATSVPSRPHAMHTVYPGSKTVCIDLTSFYFACSASYNPNSGAQPISCGITVEGFKLGNGGEKPDVITTFDYTPTFINDPSSPPNSTASMTKGVLPQGWTGLRAVKFFSKATNATYKRPTTYFDDVVYTAYNGTCV